MLLDIACGNGKEPGWTGIDIARLPGVDIVHDLLEFPWPIESRSVGRARCSHFFEHVPARLRPAFMNELWRILAPGGTADFYTPLGLWRQCQDLSHEWPPIVPASYFYFNSDWLKAWGLEHYRELHGIACDFEVDVAGLAMSEAFRGADPATVGDLARHTLNAADDLQVRLTKRG